MKPELFALEENKTGGGRKTQQHSKRGNMKAILFDLDGTLIDSFEGIAKSAQYALRRFGINEEDLQKLRPFVGPPLVESFQKLYGLSKEQAVEATEIYRERYRPIGILECSLYPGVEECIKILRADGYLIGMASSKPEEFCRRILDHFGLLELFDDVVGATFDRRIDTKEEVLNEVLRRWKDIPKDQMSLVGDTMFDLEGAKKIGIDCIAVSYGFGDAKEMLQNGAIAICDGMAELPKLIHELKRE